MIGVTPYSYWMAFTSSSMPSPPASRNSLKLRMSLDLTLANISFRAVTTGIFASAPEESAVAAPSAPEASPSAPDAWPSSISLMS